MYNLKFKKSARDDLKRIPQGPQRLIAERIGTLRDGDPKGTLDIAPIKGSAGYYRLRSGRYRVIFYLDEDDPKDLELLIVGIKSRTDAYA